MNKPRDDRRRASGFGSYGKNGGSVLNVRAEMMKRRGWIAGVIDTSVRVLARPEFFAGMVIAHVLWILLNIESWWPYKPIDPYPFTFLATVASVEAPFLSLLILMRQHRDGRIDELREEIHLQVSLHVEHELTECIKMVAAIHERMNAHANINQERLQQVMKPLHPEQLMEHLRNQLDQLEKESSG